MNTGMDVCMSRWLPTGKRLDRQINGSMGRNIGRWLKIYKYMNKCREVPTHGEMHVG